MAIPRRIARLVVLAACVLTPETGHVSGRRIEFSLKNYKGEQVDETFSVQVLRFETVEVLKDDVGTWVTDVDGKKWLSRKPGPDIPATISVADADAGLMFELNLRSVRDGVNKIPYFYKYASSLELSSLEALEGRTVILFLNPPSNSPVDAPKKDATPEQIFGSAFGKHFVFSIVPGMEDLSKKRKIVRLIAKGYENAPPQESSPAPENKDEK